jgi:hypothetical protein
MRFSADGNTNRAGSFFTFSLYISDLYAANRRATVLKKMEEKSEGFFSKNLKTS